MSHLRRLTTLFCISILLSACATGDGTEADRWKVSEPGDDSLNTASAGGHQDETEDPHSGHDQPTEEEVPPLDCSQVGDASWTPEELPAHLYRHFSCQREESENILFSPAAIWISLAERAEELGGLEGRLLAEQLGFSSIAELVDASEIYRNELLGRQPQPSIWKSADSFYEYWFEEEDLERLHEAVGVEFYSIDCEAGTDSECQWVAQNGRWSEVFLNHVPPGIEATKAPPTSAMILRGQLESPPIPISRRLWDFQVAPDHFVTPQFLNLYPDAEAHTDEISVFESHLVGDEISLLLITSRRLTLAELERASSVRSLRQWVASLERTSPLSGPHIRLPLFSIEHTVNLRDPLRLSNPLLSTTRFTLSEEGINFPNSIELFDEFDSGVPAVRFGRYRYTLDRPFLFVVYDHPTETILLMGRVANP